MGRCISAAAPQTLHSARAAPGRHRATPTQDRPGRELSETECTVAAKATAALTVAETVAAGLK